MSMIAMVRKRGGEPRPAILPERAARLLEMVRDGVMVADIQRGAAPILYVNKGFEQITGYKRDEIVGMDCRVLKGEDDDQPELEDIRTALVNRRAVTTTLRTYRKNGNMFWNEVRFAPLDGQTLYAAVLRDVSWRKEAQSRLDWSSSFDRLTGCLNRYALIDKLTGLNSHGSDRLLVIQINISGFGWINSGFGQAAGDSILLQVARRLEALGVEALGRVGSDEFVIALRAGDAQAVDAHLARIETALKPRFPLRGSELSSIRVRFALGYVSTDPGIDGLTLLRRAATAVACAKGSGSRQVSEFDELVSQRSAARIRMAEELQLAVGRGELIYHYQPKVDLATGAIVGAEALLRWDHPRLGLLAPDEFIDIAQETDLIVDITTTGIQRVAAFVAKINAGRTTPLDVAVNVSARGLQHGGLPQTFRKATEAAGVDPHWMTIELTEGVMAEDSPELIDTFRAFREMGFGLSIDDFGTGYSSLGYLQVFPITEIKIDRTFVSGILGERAKQIVAEAVVKLGCALGVSVVAEGIETEVQAKALRAMGCKYGQGYLYGRPMPPEKFLELVKSGSIDSGN